MTGLRDHDQNNAGRLAAALEHPETSVRLSAALRAGSHPRSEYVDPLVDRCAVEPDFFVRDMLTWALIRHDRASVVARLLTELTSPVAQARSQALHTLSKVGDTAVWPAIGTELLFDADDEVARAAWRTAAALVPAGAERGLAEALATQLGRGSREVLLSLSRALVTLGDAALPVVRRAQSSDDPVVRAHARATEQLAMDPEAGFDDAVEEAKRVQALRGAPTIQE